jgi:hypothetical protein
MLALLAAGLALLATVAAASASPARAAGAACPKPFVGIRSYAGSFCFAPSWTGAIQGSEEDSQPTGESRSASWTLNVVWRAPKRSGTYGAYVLQTATLSLKMRYHREDAGPPGCTWEAAKTLELPKQAKQGSSLQVFNYAGPKAPSLLPTHYRAVIAEGASGTGLKLHMTGDCTAIDDAIPNLWDLSSTCTYTSPGQQPLVTDACKITGRNRAVIQGHSVVNQYKYSWKLTAKP